MKIILLLVAVWLIFLGAISADDNPLLKDGLWSIHTQLMEHPGEKRNETDTSYCRNHAHDERERTTTKQGANCKTVSDNSSGRTRITETECTASDAVIRTKLTLTVVSDTVTHTETITAFNPPSAGRTGTTIVTDQKYVGPCPSGVVPGDLLDAAGKVFHHGKP